MTLLAFEPIPHATMPTVNVYFEGPRRSFAGRIKKTHSGWQYFPRGSRDGGEPFTTLDACKDSLRDDAPVSA